VHNVFETELGYRVAFQEALAAGLGVTTLTTHAPQTPPPTKVRALVARPPLR
jgi:hypothetical protein